MTSASEAPALSFLYARRGTRRGKPFHSRRWGLILFCILGTKQERTGGTSVICFILSRRGMGRGSRRQSKREASEETVTLGINLESCNSHYHGEWVAKPGHASPVCSLVVCLPAYLASPRHIHTHAHVHGPARPGRHRRWRACACVARLYPFLNFSIWMDEVQPYKSSQRLVKFQSGTNIKCPTVTHHRVLLIY
jgi:hypothetical protein